MNTAFVEKHPTSGNSKGALVKENQIASGFLLNTCCGQQTDYMHDRFFLQDLSSWLRHHYERNRNENLLISETSQGERIYTLTQR